MVKVNDTGALSRYIVVDEANWYYCERPISSQSFFICGDHNIFHILCFTIMSVGTHLWYFIPAGFFFFPRITTEWFDGLEKSIEWPQTINGASTDTIIYGLYILQHLNQWRKKILLQEDTWSQIRLCHY